MLAFLVSFQSIVSFRSGGIPLAAGDVFTAGDYKVTITEITSGSPSGYNGKGYVEQMKLIRVGGVSGAEPTIAQKVAVTLENTVVNDCYELAGGKVVSAYDPDWKGILDIDQAVSDAGKFIEDLGNLIDNIKNWSVNYTDAQEDKEAILEYKEQIKALKDEIEGDLDYKATDIPFPQSLRFSRDSEGWGLG